jgi:hypothetical protein
MLGHHAIDQVRELADRMRDLQNSLICNDCRQQLEARAAHELTQGIGHGAIMRDGDVIRVTVCADCAQRIRAFRRAFLQFGIDVAPWEPDEADEG